MSTFRELGLLESLVESVEALGFETPTSIQLLAIPIFLERKNDLIALAQTGTGKTAAFGLPILHHLRTNEKQTQALVISPTRELCMQIASDLKNLSKKASGMRVVAVYGGSSISAQIKELRQGAHIIVATPGRLMDMIDRKAIKLDQIETVVLDEADEMLNMGFQEDIESILSNTPEDKITGLFSATMPREIRQIANKYLRNPVEVSSGKKNSTSTDITHQYAVVQSKDKLSALKRIIDFNEDFFGIIFCTTRLETQDISDAIVKAGYNADCLHGDLSQQQRDKVMGKFRKHTIKILCATDVAARGIDVKDITHVIHYHLPDDIENYTHRSGRTARAGKKGISIALLHIREAYKMHQIEKMANMKFEKFMIPRGEEIITKRINNFVDDLCSFDTSEFSPLKPEWISPLLELSKEELIDKIIHKQMTKLNSSDMEHDDLNIDESNRGRGGESKRRESGGRESSGRERRSSGGGEDEVRLFINLGKKDNIRYDEMRELIFQRCKVSGHHIKDIDMQGVYSFFNTDSNSADRILQGIEGTEYQGREVRVERSSDRQGGAPSERQGAFKSGGFKRDSRGGDSRSGGGENRSAGRSFGKSSSSSSSAPKKSFGKKRSW